MTMLQTTTPDSAPDAEMADLEPVSLLACCDLPPALRLAAVQQLLPRESPACCAAGAGDAGAQWQQQQPGSGDEGLMGPLPTCPLPPAAAAAGSPGPVSPVAPEPDPQLGPLARALQAQRMQLLARLQLQPPPQQQQQQQQPQVCVHPTAQEQQDVLRQLLLQYAAQQKVQGAQQPLTDSRSSSTSAASLQLQPKQQAGQEPELPQCGAPSAPTQQQQQQEHRQGRLLVPHCAGSNSGAPLGAGRPIHKERVRWRPQHTITVLEQLVDSLHSELHDLGDTKQGLEGLQARLELQLSTREREVEEWLLLKHQNLEAAPPEEGEEDEPPPRILLGAPPSVFNGRVIPSVAGALPAPGALPMFAPLPPDALVRYAKNGTTLWHEARLLRAAALHHPAEAAAVEAYLCRRAQFCLQVHRRFYLLNPVFVLQLRALNLATLQPAAIPPGFWQRVAQSLATLLTPTEHEQLRVCYRMFTACMKGIRKEQDAVVQQIKVASKQLQHLKQPLLAADNGAAGTPGSPPLPAAAAAAATPAAAAAAAAAAGAGVEPSVVGSPLSPVAQAAAAATAGQATHAASKRSSHKEAMQVLQVQQQLAELLQRYEVLLLREHDQHVLFMSAGTKIPANPKLQLELIIQSYPFGFNMDAILPLIAEM